MRLLICFLIFAKKPTLHCTYLHHHCLLNRRVKPPPSKRAIKQSETSNNATPQYKLAGMQEKYRRNTGEIQLDVRNKTVSNTRSKIRSAPRWSTACLLPQITKHILSEKAAKKLEHFQEHFSALPI